MIMYTIIIVSMYIQRPCSGLSLATPLIEVSNDEAPKHAQSSQGDLDPRVGG